MFFPTIFHLGLVQPLEMAGFFYPFVLQSPKSPYNQWSAAVRGMTLPIFSPGSDEQRKVRLQPITHFLERKMIFQTLNPKP